MRTGGCAVKIRSFSLMASLNNEWPLPVYVCKSLVAKCDERKVPPSHSPPLSSWCCALIGFLSSISRHYICHYSIISVTHKEISHAATSSNSQGCFKTRRGHHFRVGNRQDRKKRRLAMRSLLTELIQISMFTPAVLANLLHKSIFLLKPEYKSLFACHTPRKIPGPCLIDG